MINPFDIEEGIEDLNVKITDLTLVISLLIKQDNKYSEIYLNDTIFASIKSLYFEAGIMDKNLKSNSVLQKIKDKDFPTFGDYMIFIEREIHNDDNKTNLYLTYIYDQLRKLKENGYLNLFDGNTDLI